jgi:hypothetical protein
MGFITKGIFGGALLGGVYGGYKSNDQTFGGFATSVGLGAIKGAALGGIAGGGVRLGVAGYNKGLSKIMNPTAAAGTKIVSNAPKVTSQQAVIGAGLGSHVGPGLHSSPMVQNTTPRGLFGDMHGPFPSGLRGRNLKGAKAKPAVHKPTGGLWGMRNQPPPQLLSFEDFGWVPPGKRAVRGAGGRFTKRK